MITLQHTLVTLKYLHNNVEEFKKLLPYVLLPDAIRYHLKNRQCSHFEIAKNQEISWLKFPKDIKNFDPDELEKHLVDEQYIPKCVIGEETILSSYEYHNKDLPTDYYNGVRLHLIQDRVFDTFIRLIFDCSKKYDDIFMYKKQQYNGKEFRDLIAKMEQQGVYLLAKQLYEIYGITTNQEWFDINIYPVLKEAYSEEMCENTYKYMKIDDDINTLITNHQFDSMNYIVLEDILEYMYKIVLINSFI